MSSPHGRTCADADYDCSKGAVRNLIRTLALELVP